jgi:hypothetical protein
LLFRRDHHCAKRRKSTIDAKESETSMPPLGAKKPIEWIAVTLTQFARDEQRLRAQGAPMTGTTMGTVNGLKMSN